ncbi:BLUF domain-containing protein, partial [Staphylococcus sp. SIMBA_130]
DSNHTNNITGILCYGNGYFFQCVEGSEQALTNLKNRLLVDDRHKDLEILDFSEITERRFGSWSLRSITLERWMTKDPELKKLM